MRGTLRHVLRLPAPRGATSETLLERLAGAEPGDIGAVPLPDAADPLADEDLHLSLYLCYELHYRGLPEVDERFEWEPSLIAVRARREKRF